jgi:LPS-assembly protein
VAHTPTDCPAPGPAPNRVTPGAPTGDITIVPGSFAISADTSLELTNGVELRQGDRTIRAESVRRDANGDITVPGPVEISDPTVTVRGQQASVSSSGAAEVTGTEFELPARAGRGAAERIRIDRSGELQLDAVRYTTCPESSSAPAWQLRAGTLKIDAQAQTGSARNARVEVRGVPILYTPYLSFPVGNQRKSGLLYPSFADSTRSGLQITLPAYLNLAPNYDLTLIPTWYEERGVELGTEFRFITEDSDGELFAAYLPDDQVRDRDRSLVQVQAQSRLTEDLRISLVGKNVGDTDYFEDFGGTPEATSEPVLPRVLQLDYRGDRWNVLARAQHYQVIDRDIPRELRPYALLPQVAMHGELAFGMLDAELTAFEPRDSDVQTRALRLDIAPELRWRWRGGGWYVEPGVGWRYTAYDLDTQQQDQPDRSLPIVSLDGGLAFERDSGTNAQRILTLEPRALYLYVPYRNQTALPLFDTALPDFNLIQLFERNRYVGGDRVGDANHLALGITSRLLEAVDGRQFLSATVGEIFRFSDPKVTLPSQPADTRSTSDLVGELSVTAFRNWNARVALQWDPRDQRTQRSELAVQYRPEPGKVVNLGYRFRNDTPAIPDQLKQVDASVAWPVARNFAAYARAVYSLQDSKSIERLVGFEYRSCCWAMRVVAARSIFNSNGDDDTSYKWEFELRGLASVGNADAFLTRSIRGYSPADPE